MTRRRDNTHTTATNHIDSVVAGVPVIQLVMVCGHLANWPVKKILIIFVLNQVHWVFLAPLVGVMGRQSLHDVDVCKIENSRVLKDWSVLVTLQTKDLNHPFSTLPHHSLLLQTGLENALFSYLEHFKHIAQIKVVGLCLYICINIYTEKNLQRGKPARTSDTKLSDDDPPQFWSFGKCGVPLHRYYSQIHSDPKW